VEYIEPVSKNNTARISQTCDQAPPRDLEFLYPVIALL